MNRPDKPVCFISYNHDDVDRDTIVYLRNWLIELAENNLEILFDEELNPGKDLNRFMRKLREVDAILLIMTPGYKNKVGNPKTGVSKEYNLIYERYADLEEKRKTGEEYRALNFALIPILLKGNQENAVLEEIEHVKYLNLVNFRAQKDNNDKLFINRQIEQEYKPKLMRVIDEIKTISSLNSAGFKKIYDKLYDSLFTVLKAEWHQSPEELELQKELFVKTSAYIKVSSQAGYLLIGRKGSGKSTAAAFMANQGQGRYKGIISIIADEFNLDMLFGLFHVDRVQSDTRNVVTIQKTFQFAWELFFYVCCMEILVQEHSAKRLTSYQESKMPPISRFISKLQGEDGKLEQEIKKSVYFTFSLNAVIEFLDHCIKSARANESFFIADIERKFTFQGLTKSVLGSQAVESFYKIIDTCRRRFLITLDGFDTAFDEYRQTTIRRYEEEQIEKRTELEIEWLRALLNLVLRIKLDQRVHIKLYDLMDFCITVPRDRFLEVQRVERDSYVYHTRYVELNWSGPELAILLRKRLEVLSGFRTDKKINNVEVSVKERLSQLLKKEFSYIPENVTTTLDGRSYTMPLFLYILRHTFWRPRDVLFYYANILAMAKDMKQRSFTVTNEAIRRTVKDTTFRVINSEFINEFKSILTNINEVITAFSNCKQVLSLEEVERIVGPIELGVTQLRQHSVKTNYERPKV